MDCRVKPGNDDERLFFVTKLGGLYELPTLLFDFFALPESNPREPSSDL